MLNVPVQKDVSEYKSKVIGKLSGRALVTIIGAVGCAVLTAIWLWFVAGLNPSDFGWLLMIVAVPFWAVGFLKPSGMYFEEWLPRWLNHSLSNNALTYRSFAVLTGIKRSVKLEEEQCLNFKEIKGYEGYLGINRDI